ncbi:hypothetical protein SCLCIDRAFT_848921 [Scleroderma citrinum Foug A]|uniref:Mitochondrial outer membrane transport complex Sam37/metaxin N-terminal domain-containing protein n=1 Tax=Scleroderma citrinum Foug A TaxID=1036808 RepID=A0A0C3AB90_9AGAM|nr:hypothetical protein SCLCIDRAFT_848921 [Scleroderma citrinum Foug A]
MSDAPYILHILPPKWDLQSLDPACLAAIMYLQLSMPGKFQVAACSDPDVSPNGLLPFLTHGHLSIASLPAIVSFVASLSKTRTPGVTDIDASLSPSQKAQRTAWWSHVESNLGDLVSHIFYGVDSNFWGLTKPTLASIMPVPQRYYVPGRIRESYRPRLESSGLWSIPAAEQEKKNPFSKDQRKQEDNKGTFARVFEREKVTEKARTIFGIHARLLEEKQFLCGDGLTSLDVYLTAHILLLANPPFPDSVLQVLLLENYPSLVDHARRIQAEVARAPAYESAPPPQLSILSLFSSDRSITKPEAKPTNPDIVRFRRMRWMWIAFTLGAAAYHIWNRFEIRRVPDDDQEDGVAKEETKEEVSSET